MLPRRVEKGDFCHLISSNQKRIDSGTIDSAEGCKVTFASAINQETFELVYSENENAWFIPLGEHRGINPKYPFYLEKDDRRLPIKTG